MRKIAIVVTLFFLFFAVCGCGAKKATDEKTLVARVNNYEMTTGDFMTELELMTGNKNLFNDPERMKEDLLEEMINRQLLLQEAQRQNFDKDRAFMKEIERYWEQALLKLLYKKKIKELLASIKVDDSEVMSEYNRLIDEKDIDMMKKPIGEAAAELKEEIRGRKLNQSINAWFEELKKGAAIKRYKENLKNIEVR